MVVTVVSSEDTYVDVIMSLVINDLWIACDEAMDDVYMLLELNFDEVVEDVLFSLLS